MKLLHLIKIFLILDFKQRKIVIENIKYVNKVIPQQTLDYVENLNLLNQIMLFMEMIGKWCSKKNKR